MGRRVKHPMVNHAAVANHARALPGTWLLIGTYRASSTAGGIANKVRCGRLYGAYAPAGAFEARTGPRGEETGVWIRHVGQPIEGAAS